MFNDSNKTKPQLVKRWGQRIKSCFVHFLWPIWLSAAFVYSKGSNELGIIRVKCTFWFQHISKRIISCRFCQLSTHCVNDIEFSLTQLLLFTDNRTTFRSYVNIHFFFFFRMFDVRAWSLYLYWGWFGRPSSPYYDKAI